MKHKLEFVKITKSHLFAGVGFGGNIFIVLSTLSNLPDEDILIVDMETNECACTQSDLKKFDTKNCWEFYFDQSSIQDGEIFKKTNSLVQGKINYTSNFLVPNDFENLKKKFYKSFQLKPYIIKILEEFHTNNLSGKITLGVQIRLTDMKNNHSVSGLDSYIRKINEIIETNPQIEQIFISTDDNKVISTLENTFTKKIIYHEGIFRADESNLHLNPYDRFNSSRQHHKYYLGLEVILEIFTLTRCDYMLKADVSSLSMVATILSDKIKKIYEL